MGYGTSYAYTLFDTVTMGMGMGMGLLIRYPRQLSYAWLPMRLFGHGHGQYAGIAPSHAPSDWA